MKKHLAASFLGGLLPVLLLGATGLTLRHDGILFPDGTLQTTAAKKQWTRSFYLTISTYDGVTFPTACEDGYHPASFREITNTSLVSYAFDLADAAISPDSGQGPPANKFGWVGTGMYGSADCDQWQSNSPDDSGTQVSLPQDMADNSQARFDVGLWETASSGCDSFKPVWCVED